MHLNRYVVLAILAATAPSCDAAVEDDLFVPDVALRPPKSGCSDCILTTTTIDPDAATAEITISSRYVGYGIKSVEISAYDDDGAGHTFEVTSADLDAGAIVPRTGPVREFEIPIALDGVKPVRASIEMSFIDPSSERTIATWDGFRLVTSP